MCNPELGEHSSNLFLRMINYDKSIPIYKYNYLFMDLIEKEVSTDELNYINELLNKYKNEKIVGLQLYTGRLDSATGEWIAKDGDRSLDEKTAEMLIDLARINNIRIINLTPHPYENLYNSILHLKTMSVAAYTYFISKLDLVIGIDSSAGHIASFYNVPTVTIWKSSPAKFKGSHTGYRVLRNNYSVAPATGDKMSPEIVIDTAKKVLNNELKQSSKIISYDDTKNGYNIIYV